MDKGGSLFLDSINTTVYAENLLFFWETAIMVHARQKVATETSHVCPAPSPGKE